MSYNDELKKMLDSIPEDQLLYDFVDQRYENEVEFCSNLGLQDSLDDLQKLIDRHNNLMMFLDGINTFIDKLGIPLEIEEDNYTSYLKLKFYLLFYAHYIVALLFYNKALYDDEIQQTRADTEVAVRLNNSEKFLELVLIDKKN